MGFITTARIDARMNAVRNGLAICNKKGRSAASMMAKKIRGHRCSILEDSCVEVPVYSRQAPECAKTSSIGVVVSDANYGVSPTRLWLISLHSRYFRRELPAQDMARLWLKMNPRGQDALLGLCDA